MSIICVAMTYENAPIWLLERLAVPEDELPGRLRGLRAEPGIGAAMILSTCNRFEVYLESELPTGEAARLVAPGLGEHLVGRRDVCAVEHLCSVAAGLESMALGEPQIITQLRRAVRVALPTMGPELMRAVRTALRAGRRVRAETDIGRAGGSLVEAGLRLAAQELGGLAGRTALVIGAGSVGSLACRSLRAGDAARIRIANRSRPNAVRLAASIDGEVVAPGGLPAALAGSDLVVTAVRAAGPVLSVREIEAARPVFLLDLGLPRNVEPCCRELAGVRVVDIQDLGRRLAPHYLPDEVDRARSIVAEEVAAYLTAHHERVAVPLIAALRGQAREVVEAELVRMHRRLPGLDEHVRQETAATIHRVVGKLLHEPTVRAKELSATPEGAVYLEALSRLYGLTAGEAKV